MPNQDAIGVGRNQDGRLQIFVIGTDHHVWSKYQTTVNGGWSGWVPFGGYLPNEDAIGVGRNRDGRLQIFVIGTDHQVWTNYQTQINGGWSGWVSLGGSLLYYQQRSIGVGSNQDGRLEIFVIGNDHILYTKYQTQINGGGWSGWTPLWGHWQYGDQIGVGSNQDGRLEVFLIGDDKALYTSYQTQINGGWSGWVSFGGSLSNQDAIGVGSNQDGRLEIFVIATDQKMWTRYQTTVNGGWSDWVSLGGPSPPNSQPPAITAVSPRGGPITGGSVAAITGANFTSDTRVLFAGLPAARVTVNSPTSITALTPDVSRSGHLWGQQQFELDTQGGQAFSSFIFFVPQIGTLVFRDPTLPSTNNEYFSYCTAEVVQSVNRDVLLTAGHCLDSGGTAHDEVAFAPGYYGPLCKVLGTTAGAVAADAFNCGTTPYGIWYERDAVLDTGFVYGGQQGLDFGFVILKAKGGTHVVQVVGGLGLVWCSGQSFPFHPTCDAGSGATQVWTAYGQPDPSVGLQKCGPSSVEPVSLSKTGPDSLSLSPCAALGGGASGGPWMNSSTNTIGAINKGFCGPSVCTGGDLSGTYLGDRAQADFNSAQYR